VPDSAILSKVDIAAMPRRSTRLLIRWVLMTTGIAVVAVGTAYAYLTGGRYVTTDNAYVRADIVAVSAEVAGRVAQVAVVNDQRVAEGALLFKLDDEPYRIAAQAARAQLGMVRNDIASLQATYRQKLAQIRKAEADVSFYQRDKERQQDLASRQVASQARLDESHRNTTMAEQQLAALRLEASSALASLDGNVDAPTDSYWRVRQAQAQLDRVERDLRLTEIRAMRPGIATNVDKLQKGAYLAAGQIALSLVADDHIWVDANPKESDLTHVQAGAMATVAIDTYPGRTWQAKVVSISAASGAEFALLPAQNASGNWIKVVQRIPVRLRIELTPGMPVLRSGMSAYVTIDTGHRRSLRDLF
jgi:membrane fusion protein, multidrug efflux system